MWKCPGRVTEEWLVKFCFKGRVGFKWKMNIGVQITEGGIYFAFNKIELIRGEQYLVEHKISELDLKEINNTFNARSLNIFKRLSTLFS